MAFQTIWSVDLGRSALKAVKLRRERNNVEILAVDKVDYPLSENGAEFASQSKDALSVFRTRNEVKDPVVVSHPGQGTFSRFIKVPAFDPKKVKDMVRYEASQQIPFPLDEVIWDYHVIERDYLPGEEREVGLFAVRRETVDDYLLEFTQEGLAVEMLTIGYLGLLNFIKYDINPQEPAVVLDIGAAHTDLILVDGARFWIRPLPHSGNDVSKAIMARFKLPFADAEKLKLETSKAPQADKIFKGVIQPKLQELVQEVQRSIGYYRTQAGEVNFTKLYLLGNGSRVVGITKFLEESLNMAVERVQTIGRLRVSRDVNLKLLQSEISSFGTALGLGIQAVGAGTCQVDLVPREEKLKKQVARKRKHVFIAAGMLALAILLAYALIGMQQGKLQSAIDRVERDKMGLGLISESKIKQLEQLTTEGLGKKMEILRGLAEARNGALEGIRTLERVLGASAKRPLAGIVDEKDTAGVQKLVEERKARLKEQVWIPYLKMELVQYPDQSAGAPAAKKAAKGAPQQETVPAYKVTAFAMVKEGENAQASSDSIKSLLTAPLTQDLITKNWTQKKDVVIQGGTEAFQSIFYVPQGGSGPGGGGGGERGKGEVVIEGGPFFGAQVSWYMLPRYPKAPEAAAAEEPDAKADKPTKTDKKRQPK